MAEHEDHYECDRCGDFYYFVDAYHYTPPRLIGNIQCQGFYSIDGWYGGYDGQDMCESCQDSY